jgi:hypothetical protein
MVSLYATFGGLCLQLDARLVLEALDRDAQVQLAQPAQHGLLRRRDPLELEAGVLVL